MGTGQILERSNGDRSNMVGVNLALQFPEDWSKSSERSPLKVSKQTQVKGDYRGRESSEDRSKDSSHLGRTRPRHQPYLG
jgi:hypothetical protein